MQAAEHEPLVVDDIRDALVVRENGLFLLTTPDGNVQPEDAARGFGLYYQDTRHLSAYDLSFHQRRPVVLLSTAALGFSAEQVLTNPYMHSLEGRLLPRETVQVRRQRVISDVLEEIVRVTNYNAFPVSLDLVYRFAADFADIFEVRGWQRRERGELFPAEAEPDRLTFRYRGTDGALRTTAVRFLPQPHSIDAQTGQVVFRVRLEPRESRTLSILVTVNDRAAAPVSGTRFEAVSEQYRRWRERNTRVYSSNEIFNATIERALDDLRMLWNKAEDGAGYLAAGTPWFDALFGRDTLITSLQTLAFNPDIARSTLKVLAQFQGKTWDDWRDEEPGKILHELRFDELTRAGELPMSPYYGTVDATPLYVLLASEYWRWTRDDGLLRELRPVLEDALAWIDTYGDRDADGYVEYARRSTRGLLNQGWKDSGDAIIYEDGRLVRPPIALVEVQAYVYAAKRGMAELFRHWGEEDRAARLQAEAEQLRRRFNRDFWLPGGYYALALDGEKRQAAAVTSNPGHALWCGIVTARRAGAVITRLMRNDLFSGWGIRTLSSDSPRFNPMGYHVGSIWPHDNSLIAMGMKRYGYEVELNEVATALFDAASAFDYYRLPELFVGSARSGHQAPVPYPVACRPQAWAAGTMLLLTQAILGLAPDAPNGRLFIVRPRLPYWLDHVQVRGLHVGEGTVDLLYERRNNRTSVAILAAHDVAVHLVPRWPH
ncbi:MAG TPA: amylo-alpha-1,6-glucosidase [Dehalococcoidia bacterium]